MSDFRIDQITNQAGTAGPQIAGITTFSGSSGLVMPSGATEYRGGRGRGLFGGGTTPGNTNIISYITITTAGNAQDFGDLSVVRRGTGAAASSTRGLWAGGLNSTIIDYVEIQSTGNAFNFGDLSAETFYPGGASDRTRALFAGGYEPPSTFYKKIDYITIATKGKASDFGFLKSGTNATGGENDILRGGKTDVASCASPTRAIFAGGNEGYNYPTTAIAVDSIDYVTIQTLGNAFDFGDLIDGRTGIAGCSSSTRGVFAGGHTGPTLSPLSTTNAIQYITIASLGNAIDFGDLTQDRERFHGTSNSIRGVFNGGQRGSPATRVNTIDYVTIASLGNAVNFGNLTTTTAESGACSDAHGGLGD